jgi:HJR/Mrr/RecB family endonuclease
MTAACAAGNTAARSFHSNAIGNKETVHFKKISESVFTSNPFLIAFLRQQIENYGTALAEVTQ